MYGILKSYTKQFWRYALRDYVFVQICEVFEAYNQFLWKQKVRNTEVHGKSTKNIYVNVP